MSMPFTFWFKVVAAFVYQIQVLSLTFNTLSGIRPVMSLNLLNSKICCTS